MRGSGGDRLEEKLVEEVAREVQERAGITDDQVMKMMDDDVIDRGPLNWEFTQGILRAVDRYVPFGSGVSIALATRDVYRT